MANQVTAVSGIAIGDIETINGKTDDNIAALRGREFTGTTRYTQTEDLTHSAEQTAPYDAGNGRGYHNSLGWLYREGTTDRVLSGWFGYYPPTYTDDRVTCLQYNGTSAPTRTAQSIVNSSNGGWWLVGLDTDPNTENEAVVVFSAGDVANDPVQVARVLVNDSTDAITFGTPVSVTSAHGQGQVSHDKNRAGDFLTITYLNPAYVGGDCFLRAGTTSGSTITLGTALDTSIDADFVTMDADPNNAGRYAVGWHQKDDDKIYVAVATVSGTTITLGTPLAVSDAGGMNEDGRWVVWDKTRADTLHIAFTDDDSNSGYPTQIGASVAAGPTGTTVTASSTGAEVAESVHCDGVSISSDYFINNPHVAANQGAGFLLRSTGGASNDTKLFAWTCDEDQDYTMGNSSTPTAGYCPSRNGIIASPYTAGLHMMLYQDDVNAPAFQIRAKALLLGGQWDA